MLQRLSGPINAEIVDADGDGDADIVTLVSQEWEEIYVFENDGKGGFTPRRVFGASNEDFGSSWISMADLDRDGDVDIVYSNGDAFDYAPPTGRGWNGLQWLENRGGLAFRYHRIGDFPGASSPQAVDLDGDGDVDVAVVSDNTQAGLLAGLALARRLPAGSRVAIADGLRKNANADRVAGFLDALRDHPALELVAHERGPRDDAASGRAVAERLLAADPDIDGVFAVCDPIALGVTEYLTGVGRPIPALAIIRSMGPRAARMASTAAATWSRRATSATAGTALPPAAAISAASACSGSARRAIRPTRQTSAASSFASAQPIPLDAPVTIATFPVSDMTQTSGQC